MKRTLFAFVIGFVLLTLAGCNLSRAQTATAVPPPLVQASPTAPAATPAATASAIPAASATPSLPTAIPAAAAPTATSGAAPATASAGIVAGSPSGPYAVIQVASGDALNIRSGPGVGNPVIGSLATTTTNIMRTGPSATVNGNPWVQVQNPAGGTGWVSAVYLTEYVVPATFCADGRVNSLLANFGNTIKISDGPTMAALVSPAHGMTVRLWRNGSAITFYPKDARWIFNSTYAHNWGAAPGSGQDTIGAIHAVVIPKWLDVLNNSFTLSCNVPQTGGASYDTSWPAAYANLNFYSLYKPGPAGNENSWRTLLIGVDYVKGQPYIYSVTQLDWEP